MSFRKIALAVALASLAGGVAPTVSQAQTLPKCSTTLTYDPSIPTWDQFFADHPDPDAVVPLGRGGTGAGGGPPFNGSGAPNPTGRNLT
jgi:hypothetical protein